MNKKGKMIVEEGKTCHWFSVCPIKCFTEQNLIDKKWVEQYCKSAYWSCVRRKMEEKGQCHPDNMLPDGSVDEKLKDGYCYRDLNVRSER